MKKRLSRPWSNSHCLQDDELAMIIQHDRLKSLATTVFTAAGCPGHEAERVGHYLVEANLDGHDSHGVMRIPPYVQWIRAGKILPDKKLRIVFENDAIVVAD